MATQASLLPGPRLCGGFGLTYNFFTGGLLTNNGSISADVNAQTLRISQTFTNGSGNYDARNGGVLAISTNLSAGNSTITVDNSPGSAVLLDGGTISGTILSSTGSGLSVSANGNNAISSATLGNDITIAGTGYVQLFNANTISGTIHLASTGNGIQFHDGNAVLNLTGSLRGYGQTYNFFNGGTLNNSGTLAADVAGQTLSINNSFLTSTGTISVSTVASMSIGGSFNQLSGSLYVDGELFTSSPIFFIWAVSGNGLIHNSLRIGAGTISPGHSPGELTLTGNYEQDSLAKLVIDLGGYTAGSGFDRLAIGGNAAFDGTLDVELSGGFVPQVGDTFDVATWLGAENGTFSSLVTDSDIQYTVDYGSPAAQRLRITITAIPEPSSVGAGMILIAAVCNRRNRKRSRAIAG